MRIKINFCAGRSTRLVLSDFKVCFVLLMAFVFPASVCGVFGQKAAADSLYRLINSGIQDTNMANRLVKLGDLLEDAGNTDSARICFERSLVVSRQFNFQRGVARGYNRLGGIYFNFGDLQKAKQNYSKAIEIHKLSNNQKGISNNLNDLGSVCKKQGDLPAALGYHLEALKIAEQINYRKQIGLVLGNIGNVYFDLKSYDKSREYYLRCLKVSSEMNNQRSMAMGLINLGGLYLAEKNYLAGDTCFNAALKIYKEIGDERGLSVALGNLGSIYVIQGKLEKAEDHFRESLAIVEKQGNMALVASKLIYIGGIYHMKRNYELSAAYMNKALAMAIELGDYELKLKGYKALNELYFDQKEYKKAFGFLEAYHSLSDSVFAMEKEKDITRTEMNFEFEKKEALTKAEHDKQIAIADADKKRQRIFSWLITAIAISITLIALVVFRSLRITRKQKHIIEEQKAVVEEHQKEIVDSITYAKRIQDAILPPLESIRQKLPASFVLYKPKDIVAGDFYWLEEFDGIIFIAAADCTGHGVPGAMVSLVCSNALTRAVKEFGLRDTGKILDKANELVLETFEKSSEEVKDGMDISLLSIDQRNKKINWSGANNPLWFIGDGLTEIKGDKQPIGKTEFPKPFTTHKIEYSKGTEFFLFTDGLADQFGGPLGKKYKYKQFSDLLTQVYSLNNAEQVKIIEKSFTDWKSDLEQVDDVCVIGIMI